MTEQQSKARQQAEISFSNEQTQFFAKGHAVEELNSAVLAREEKTLRLRAARLAKEQEDAALNATAKSPKRGKRTVSV